MVQRVVADLTLGCASTVHADEGRTVDTTDSVLGARTDLPGLAVTLTRGRPTAGHNRTEQDRPTTLLPQVAGRSRGCPRQDTTQMGTGQLTVVGTSELR